MHGGNTGDTGITREGHGSQSIRLGGASVIIALITVVHTKDIALVQNNLFLRVDEADRVRFQRCAGKNGETEGHNGG